jgi:hypothetical protein
MNRPEFARFRTERLVFHGTRKNAVNALLEVGCSEARVAAIVNMSPAMVHHYSKKVSQFRLARAAMAIRSWLGKAAAVRPRQPQDREMKGTNPRFSSTFTTLVGPTMFVRIGVMRALSRDVEHVFNSSRNDTHWGRRKLARDR